MVNKTLLCEINEKEIGCNIVGILNGAIGKLDDDGISKKDYNEIRNIVSVAEYVINNNKVISNL